MVHCIFCGVCPPLYFFTLMKVDRCQWLSLKVLHLMIQPFSCLLHVCISCHLYTQYNQSHQLHLSVDHIFLISDLFADQILPVNINHYFSEQKPIKDRIYKSNNQWLPITAIKVYTTLCKVLKKFCT